MSAHIYLEGGGGSKELDIRCREGFRKLLQSCGFEEQRRMPRLFASGGRDSAFDDFSNAHANNPAGEYIAMWIDSEEPLADDENTWEHLNNVTTVSRWNRPAGASDDQVLFMTTCMETLLVSDHDSLRRYFGNKLQEPSLPPLVNLEHRSRQDIQNQLVHATRECPKAYSKGKQSFEILAMLTPVVLERYLPSFRRVRRILNEKL